MLSASRFRVFRLLHQQSDRNAAFTLVELLVVISIIGILMGLTLNGVQAARESARKVHCSGNLRQQALALHNFHVTHKTLPLGNDRLNYRDHSWASAILSQIEQNAIADQWDFSVPWNHALRNAELAKKSIPLLRCPSSIVDLPGDTDYAGVAGSLLADFGSVLAHGPNNGVLIASTPRRLNPISLPEIFDGTSHTLLLAEVVDRDAAEHGLWADGANVITQDNGGINVANSGEVFSRHPGGAFVVASDGAIRFLTESISLDVLGALCSRDGREIIPEDFTD
ncbi:DUF1559 domain-containing protein [Rubripirellula reticaptiva]|uniref:DUF1559 domain-containing protein n=1 Tax=Rubripirellula reticaptiva TaxID=2528013 RepID=A0A5C6EE94_9BACT|nr:DUF1559 domain-containing protein [Rubripirellula reticaptiva]TWU48063.1 hypothetical protein Poly59_49080 [Rubripirellula reticaptiva]